MKPLLKFTLVALAFVAVAVIVTSYNTDMFRFSGKSNEDDVDKLAIYSHLPAKPDDFDIITRELEAGSITDLCKIEREYYLQPELYPTWERAKLKFYINHDYDRWGVHGYGSYPGEQGIQVNNLKAGEEIRVCTIFKTSYGIETYQGVKLLPTDSEYFDIIVSPQTFITPPTFPQFQDDWARKVIFVLRAKKDVPPGTYTTGFGVGSPGKELSESMLWSVLEKENVDNPTYKEICSERSDADCQELFMLRQKKYVPGGQFNVNNLAFKFIVEVTA